MGTNEKSLSFSVHRREATTTQTGNMAPSYRVVLRCRGLF